MAKTRRIQRQKTATREVTVKLDGWPKKINKLTVTDEYWYVELGFKLPEGNMMVHTVFETDDYEKALTKYLAFEQIVVAPEKEKSRADT